jgi:hypothetical protein
MNNQLILISKPERLLLLKNALPSGGIAKIAKACGVERYTVINHLQKFRKKGYRLDILQAAIDLVNQNLPKRKRNAFSIKFLSE